MRLCRACSSTCVVNGTHRHIALRIQHMQGGQLAHAQQQSSFHCMLLSELVLQIVQLQVCQASIAVTCMCCKQSKYALVAMISTPGESVNFFGHACDQTDLHATVLLTSQYLVYLELSEFCFTTLRLPTEAQCQRWQPFMHRLEMCCIVAAIVDAHKTLGQRHNVMCPQRYLVRGLETDQFPMVHAAAAYCCDCCETCWIQIPPMHAIDLFQPFLRRGAFCAAANAN